MRIVRCKNSLTAVLADGRIIQTNDCTDEIFKQVKKFKEEENEFELINLLIPEILYHYLSLFQNDCIIL